MRYTSASVHHVIIPFLMSIVEKHLTVVFVYKRIANFIKKKKTNIKISRNRLYIDESLELLVYCKRTEESSNIYARPLLNFELAVYCKDES